MTGTLAQIGLLSHYAAEIFQDTFSLSEELRKRLERATERTKRLAEQLPEVCAVVAKIDGNTGGRAAKPRDFACEVLARVQFTRETMPRGARAARRRLASG